ncbi:CATRA system-associated protein [Nocardia sp. NPDC006044]|uniref:CATRA system-associated protein n=1 Tax=Nocardia sp. NPDC006044 TaxID=3364306 RepID=UPI0036CC517F
MSESVDGPLPPLPWEFELDSETREDILAVLRDATRWQLPPRRWEHVLDSVGALAVALANGDAVAVRESIAEVELMGPVRATRIGAGHRSPAPHRMLDRVHALVHSLGGEPVTADEHE